VIKINSLRCQLAFDFFEKKSPQSTVHERSKSTKITKSTSAPNRTPLYCLCI
jgi:hypothetical protein